MLCTAAAALCFVVGCSYKVDGLTWVVDLLGSIGNVPAFTTTQPNPVALTGTSAALTVQDNWVQGVMPTAYTVMGLTQGIEHFVRVAANSQAPCTRQSAFTSFVSSIPMQVCKPPRAQTQTLPMLLAT
jgi:hypothetical protein